MNQVVTAISTVYLKGTRLRNSPLVVQAGGAAVLLLPKAKGRMALAISIGAQPSAFDITQSVLNALAGDYNIPGTIGAKINASGNAGDPWSTEIEPTYTAAEIMRLMASVLAGKSSVAGGTVRFRDLNDTKDRVVAEVSSSQRNVSARDDS